MHQAGLMAGDLKVGHYLKVPPRIVFVNQIIGTILGCLFNYVVNDVCYLFIVIIMDIMGLNYHLECRDQ